MLGLLLSGQLRARLKYSRAGAPATSTSGAVKYSLAALREATSSTAPSALAWQAGTGRVGCKSEMRVGRGPAEPPGGLLQLWTLGSQTAKRRVLLCNDQWDSLSL